MNSLLDSLEILLCKSVILIDKPGYVWNEMNGASVEECCCLVCIIALLKCLLPSSSSLWLWFIPNRADASSYSTALLLGSVPGYTLVSREK